MLETIVFVVMMLEADDYPTYSIIAEVPASKNGSSFEECQKILPKLAVTQEDLDNMDCLEFVLHGKEKHPQKLPENNKVQASMSQISWKRK